MFFQQTLGRAVRMFPQATATIDGERRQTFGELDDSVRNLARWLVRQGLAPGDRVAALLPNGRDVLELTFACAYLGLRLVPLNSRLAVAELDAVLADCQPRVLFTHSAMPAPRYAVSQKVTIDQELIAYQAGPLPEPVYDPHCVLGLFYTSGTCGRPKGVMLTHLNHVANMMQCATTYQFAPGDVFLHAAPLFHMASFQLVLPTTSQGAAQATLGRFDAEAFFATVAREQVTHTALIPTMLNLLTLHPKLAEYDVRSLRCIFYGGSSIAPEVVARFRSKFPGCQLVQGYGMTETGPIMTLLQDCDHIGSRVLSCGRAVPGVELRITDDSGAPVPRGERGVVHARGLNIMSGYWNKPEETSSALSGGWMNTGDIAYEDEDGYFYIVDREKDMIITGGENVYPTEVEVALYGHPAIKEVAVVAAADAKWGEIVVACVHLKPGENVSEEELRSVCRERLAGYKVPKRFEFFDSELPKGGTGKILRRELRDRYWQAAERRVN